VAPFVVEAIDTNDTVSRGSQLGLAAQGSGAIRLGAV
jgi:hypothetical protein